MVIMEMVHGAGIGTVFACDLTRHAYLKSTTREKNQTMARFIPMRNRTLPPPAVKTTVGTRRLVKVGNRGGFIVLAWRSAALN
jgi:hypothetical protein